MKKTLFFILIFLCLLVQPAIAKILFVATAISTPAGNDSVSYANNDIDNPWLTIEKVVSEALAGDTAYFRAGVYNIATPIETRFIANAGTITDPVHYTAYTVEAVTWTTSVSPALESAAFFIDVDYFQVSKINVIASVRFFHVARTLTTVGFKYSDAEASLTIEGGSINEGVITLQAIRAQKSRIENVIFTTSAAFLSENTAAIFIWRSEEVYVGNCEFYNFPSAIFYKHTGSGIDSGSIFENNYFYNPQDQIGAGTRPMKGINSCGQYITIRNNILNGANLQIQGGAGGSGDSGLNYGGDNNIIYNNTIFKADYIIEFENDGDASGAKDNVSYNNLITDEDFEMWRYAEGYGYIGDDIIGGNTYDYTLYPTGSDIYNNSIQYTLTNWKAFAPNFAVSNDTNSIAGSPTFVGGATPTTITGFTLASGSAGENEGNDGENVGADPSTVGMDVSSTNPAVTLEADKQATSPTTYTGSFTVEAGRTGTLPVSLNGFVVTCDDGDCTDEETEAFTVSGVTVPITDTITVTDSSLEEGFDSITITLPTPAVTDINAGSLILNSVILK